MLRFLAVDHTPYDRPAAVEQLPAQADLEIDPDLGFRTDTRARRVKQARTIAVALILVSIATYLWALAYPHPYGLLIMILAAQPAVAILLTVSSQGMYQLEGTRKDPRPSLAIPMLIPAVALAMRALEDLHLLYWTRFLSIAGLCAAALALVIFRSTPRLKPNVSSLLPMSFLCAAYTLGLIAHANALLDKSPQQIFRTAVLSKHVVHGKSTSYHLELAPWGPQTEFSDVTVPLPLYDLTQSGLSVCIHFRAGALHIPWYRVARCQ